MKVNFQIKAQTNTARKLIRKIYLYLTWYSKQNDYGFIKYMGHFIFDFAIPKAPCTRQKRDKIHTVFSLFG